MSLSELRELVMDREDWRAVIHGVSKSWTRLSDWTELIDINFSIRICIDMLYKTTCSNLAFTFLFWSHKFLETLAFYEKLSLAGKNVHATYLLVGLYFEWHNPSHLTMDSKIVWLRNNSTGEFLFECNIPGMSNVLTHYLY